MNVARHYTEFPPAQPRAGVDPQKTAISVVGLGRAGSVMLACLSSFGFQMVGVDIRPDRLAAIADGSAGSSDPRLMQLLAEGAGNGHIATTQNLVGAVLETSVTMLTVDIAGPSSGNGQLAQIRSASSAIGQALAMKQGFHVIAVRSPVPPGTTLGLVREEIEKASGRRLGADFGLCCNPDFSNEAATAAEFFAPPMTVIGASDQRTASLVAAVYAGVDERPHQVCVEEAEMIGFAHTQWRATKAAFAAELAQMCAGRGIDGRHVMSALGKEFAAVSAPAARRAAP